MNAECSTMNDMTSAHFFGTMGKRLRILREERGLNQTELARLMDGIGAGVDPSYLSQIESDAKMPRLPVLVAIARALGTTTDYLLLLSDDPAPPQAQAEPETPVFFSAEADEAARLIDAMPEARRAEVLALVRVISSGLPAHCRQPTTHTLYLAHWTPTATRAPSSALRQRSPPGEQR
jgi:transcriptional regulator with XRE-family HTH domain